MILGFLDNVLELPNSAWSRLGISPNLEARGDNCGTRSCDRKSGFSEKLIHYTTNPLKEILFL